MVSINETAMGERVKLFEEKEKICDRVTAVEKVSCPKCGASLINISPWGISEWATKEQAAQKFHGVYCPINEEHFAMNITYQLPKEANKFDLTEIDGFTELIISVALL